MSCTTAEIAEKKRKAKERLNAKLNSQRNLSQNQSKVQENFSKHLNKGSEFIRVLKEKKFESRNSAHPYQKVGDQTKSSVDNNAQKLAPVLVNVINCACYLVSTDRFAVQTSSYLSKLIDVFKGIPSKAYDPDTKIWTFSIKDYDLIQTRVGNMKPNVVMGTIPANILRICSEPKTELDFACLTSLEPKLFEALLSFQKEGVCFGIAKHGRVLIADEMGLGKTYQALAIADFYKNDWPLLVCTSASTRNSWANHVRTLLPYVACHHVACLTSNQDEFSDCKVLITSYTLMEKNINKLLEKRFGVVIMDESHMLKNAKAKCTFYADRLARQAKRVILLSGTPALSRPVELFSQLQMINRSIFNFIDYTTRYCAGKQTAFGWDASGQSNLEELNVVLSKKFMIRRLKAEVLPQLAEKLRETVILDPALISINTDQSLNRICSVTDFSRFKGREREEMLIKYYAETAVAKANAVCAYVRDLVKEKNKFIVFAHHQVMMDAISDCLTKMKVDFIRIDGSTRNDLRAQFVNEFQSRESCLVALLSLRACNTGITLTAAKLVVFAELDWNPSTLAQAESRAHRIGQKNSVICRYLLANNTADDIIWKMLKTKQDVLNKVGVFEEDIHDGKHVAGPRGSPNIKKYFSVTTTEPHKSHTESSREMLTYNATESNTVEIGQGSDKELQNMFNDDDDDILANLDL